MSRLGKSKSEVHAYVHILNELKNKKAWDKGQILTQRECLSIKPLAEALGMSHPENTVQIDRKNFYVIEAKNERVKLGIALREAKVDYADKINASQKVKALFVTGIAGNSEEGFAARSQYFKNDEWTKITENGVEITGLLSKLQVERILETNDPNIKEIEINEKDFLKTAEEINGILHEGGIHKDYRARVMSAILLALVEGSEINLDEKPPVLINSINSRVQIVLQKHNKSEFSRFMSIDLPTSQDNHNRIKKAIVLTVQELLGLNIKSAMQSGKDILGTFYEVFLKYGNGAKEIGIVLTPRHITKFAAQALNIQSNDLVLDPTCGTGGFLVAAFDEVKTNSTNAEFEDFKKWGLYGIEEQDPVVALALVNMIFRGDGKNNIVEGNCFAKWLNAKKKNGGIKAEFVSSESEQKIAPITKVLMNPPFPKKKTDNKEFLFIEQALRQMQLGGLLFSVLPYSCMINKKTAYLEWRKRLLRENSILSVVTFPEDLFYPVGVHTLGLIVRKGEPHGKSTKVLWIRAISDGRLKKKGKRLESEKAKNDYPQILPILKNFIHEGIHNIKSVPAFLKSCEIDFTDADLELVAEAYLDERPISEDEINQSIEQMIRDNIAFSIKYENQLKSVNYETPH